MPVRVVRKTNQRGAGWNPFRHAKRDFENIAKAGKKVANFVQDNPALKQIISQVARQMTGFIPNPAVQTIANQGLNQLGLGRKRRAVRRGAGRASVGGAGRKTKKPVKKRVKKTKKCKC